MALGGLAAWVALETYGSGPQEDADAPAQLQTAHRLSYVIDFSYPSSVQNTFTQLEILMTVNDLGIENITIFRNGPC
jgi:hypothetical protein